MDCICAFVAAACALPFCASAWSCSLFRDGVPSIVLNRLLLTAWKKHQGHTWHICEQVALWW